MNYTSLVLKILSLPLFLVAWQLVVTTGTVNAVLFPPPTDVAQAAFHWVTNGPFWSDLWSSLSRVLVGFALGAGLGTVIGLLSGRYTLFHALVSPIFTILRPIPPIAFVPLVILWFGLGEGGKYFLVFWGVFFTVWISTHIGVQSVSPNYIRVGQCLGANDRDTFFHILLPASIPYVLVGMRTAVSVSFYTLVAAEIAGTESGIFYRIDISQTNMQIGTAMAGLLALGLISLIADRLFSLVSNRLLWSE